MMLARPTKRRKILGGVFLAALILTLTNKLAGLGALGKYDTAAVAVAAFALYFAIMFRREIL
jgi:hypothetical protein